MKIKYLAGPKAGQEEHVENKIGTVVVGAGLAVEIPSNEPPRDSMGLVTIPAPAPGTRQKLTPEWEVIVLNVGDDQFLAIKVTLLHQKSLYTGSPDYFPSRLGCWPIPDDIKNFYRREYVNNPAFQDTATAEGQRQNANRPKNTLPRRRG